MFLAMKPQAGGGGSSEQIIALLLVLSTEHATFAPRFSFNRLFKAEIWGGIDDSLTRKGSVIETSLLRTCPGKPA